MASSDNDLSLHLPLDEIEDNSVLDETENDNDGTVNGHPRLLPDDLFGSCLDFDGTDDFVEIKDPFDNSDAFTISIWVRPAAINDGTYHGFIGGESGGVRKPGLWLAPSDGGLQYDSYDAGGTKWTAILDNFFTSDGVWVHVAWVKDAAQYRFYRGGELFATTQAPPQFYRDAAGSYWLGKVDKFWKGQLAHARVYKRALTQEEIAELMLDDQTAASAFKKGHPLEFSIYDDDQQPVLVISDGQPDRKLHIEVANSSQRAIELATPASPTPSPDNYHFELKFRPGTLSASARTRLSLAEAQDGWAVSRTQQADGTISLYFLNPAPTDGAALQPGESVVLTLRNVGAEGGGGSRGTRVELRYSQLKYAGEVAQITGSRVEHLEIINERGKRNIPLHVGFLGSNRVLNDGHTPNELRLRITNALGESSIPLTPKTSDEPSTFIISFDVQGDGEQHEWALGTSGDVQSVEVNAVRHPDAGGNLELHLPLEKIEDGRTPDETSNKNDGAVNAHPSLVGDETFSSCINFDGIGDFIEVKDPFRNNNSFTISIWANPAALDDNSYHGFIGYQGGVLRKPSLYLAPSDRGLHYDSYDQGKTRYSDILTNFFTTVGEWVHIAWVKDAAQYKFYRGGELFATTQAPQQFYRDAAERYSVGRVDNFWKGRLAHARVYSRALTQDEVKQVILDDRGQDFPDTHWEVKLKGAQGKSPEWELTTPDKDSLGPGEMIQLKLSNVISSLPSGQTNLYVRYKNLPGYWDGQFVVSAEKSPLVYEGQRVGIGTNRPRSALDTGTGVLTGAANAYQKAQLMMTGGGTVTWSQKDVSSRRLKWTNRFIAISMEQSTSIPAGHINIQQPTSDIPADHVWDGQPRSANADGVVLNEWEALYAVHHVGGDENAVEFRIQNYYDFVNKRPANFTAPSNWLLVAVLNDDDKTVKLGTGVLLSLNSSSTKGSPVPTGTIMMWSGDENNIPDGWVLCNGRSDIPGLRVPDLTGRFIVGSGPGGNPAYKAGQFAEADQHAHDLKFPQYTFTTAQNGSHNHAPPGDWYDRDLLGDVSALGREYHNAIDRGSPSVKSVRTSTDGNHAHSVTVIIPALRSEQSSQPQPPKVEQWQVSSTQTPAPGVASPASAQASASATPASKVPLAQAPTWQNRPRWFALCYIMKS